MVIVATSSIFAMVRLPKHFNEMKELPFEVQDVRGRDSWNTPWGAACIGGVLGSRSNSELRPRNECSTAVEVTPPQWRSAASLSELRVESLLRREQSRYHEEMALSAEDRANKIKLVVFDVDGVLTDGQLFFLPEDTRPEAKGIEFKGFSAHDGLGMALARLGGLRLGLVTKRRSQTVAIRATDLKIEFVYQGQAHKLTAIHQILTASRLTLDQLAYVGDDIVDLPVMRLCGLAIATANARTQVKAAAHYVTPNTGGHGAGRDAIDFILTQQGTLDMVIEQYLDADNPAAAAADIGQGHA